MQPSAPLFTAALAVLGSNLCWALDKAPSEPSESPDVCDGEPDIYVCLKRKSVELLDRSLAPDSPKAADRVSTAKDRDAASDASLSRDLGGPLVDRLWRYLRTHTHRPSLPQEGPEGRKGYKGSKGGKGGGVLLVLGALAAALLQLALGKLAAIAGKALIVAKVALVLAGVAGLKGLVGGGPAESQPAQVVYAEPEHYGSWGRSIEKGGDLAYRAQHPKSNK